jgi:hypothetical protein
MSACASDSSGVVERGGATSESGGYFGRPEPGGRGHAMSRMPGSVIVGYGARYNSQASRIRCVWPAVNSV